MACGLQEKDEGDCRVQTVVHFYIRIRQVSLFVRTEEVTQEALP